MTDTFEIRDSLSGTPRGTGESIRRTRAGEMDVAYYLNRGRDLRAAALRALLRSGAGALAAAPRTLARRCGRWRRERIAYAELAALDDRALKDIGLYRGDIARLARQAADGTTEARRGQPAPRPAETETASHARPFAPARPAAHRRAA